MAGSSPEKSKRVVIYSPPAALDLAENHNHTAHHWGIEQAERYTELLQEAAQQAADHPEIGRPIEGDPTAFALSVKWKNARYGHRVVYEPIENGIYVLRILHSAMNLADHFGGE